MQCRGEWKLARVASADDVYVAASTEGIDRVSAVFVLRATFQSPLQLRGGLRGDLQGVINNGAYMQCRGEWKLARVAHAGAGTCWVASSQGDILCFHMDCVAGDLPVAPTATRWSVDVIFSVLLKIAHTCSVGASGSSPALRPPEQVSVAASPEGMICVSAWFVFRATFQSPLQLRGGALR